MNLQRIEVFQNSDAIIDHPGVPDVFGGGPSAEQQRIDDEEIDRLLNDDTKYNPVQPKYVIFKIEDWEEMLERMAGGNLQKLPFPILALMDRAIGDGVVLRRQDLFSAPALFLYANGIQVALKVLKSDPGGYNEAVVERLQKIADYFMWEGDRATEEGHKIPD